jgi:hypothetical protein
MIDRLRWESLFREGAVASGKGRALPTGKSIRRKFAARRAKTADGVNTPYRIRNPTGIFYARRLKKHQHEITQRTYEINYRTVNHHHSDHLGAGRLQSRDFQHFNRCVGHKFRHERRRQRKHQHAGNQQHAKYEYEFAGQHQSIAVFQGPDVTASEAPRKFVVLGRHLA